MSPFFIVGIKPSYKCRSLPQIAVAVIRTRISEGCSIFALGTSSTRTSSLPCQTSAFMALGGRFRSCNGQKPRLVDSASKTNFTQFEVTEFLLGDYCKKQNAPRKSVDLPSN